MENETLAEDQEKHREWLWAINITWNKNQKTQTYLWFWIVVPTKHFLIACRKNKADDLKQLKDKSDPWHLPV